MRQLIAIPIVHTPADLGSQREVARQAYITRYGVQRWHQHLEVLAQLWHRIRQRVLALPVDFTTVRLYQDGLPRCGHELAIVETLAAAGSSNHQLLLELVNRGAILMGTEDPALLLQEHDHLRKQHSAQPTPGAEAPPRMIRSSPSGTRRLPAGLPRPSQRGNSACCSLAPCTGWRNDYPRTLPCTACSMI